MQYYFLSSKEFLLKHSWCVIDLFWEIWLLIMTVGGYFGDCKPSFIPFLPDDLPILNDIFIHVRRNRNNQVLVSFGKLLLLQTFKLTHYLTAPLHFSVQLRPIHTTFASMKLCSISPPSEMRMFGNDSVSLSNT